jgi:magnesium chelatase subunit I
MAYEKLSPEERLSIKNLGELAEAGYRPISVKEELRQNLIRKIRLKQPVFSGIWGYENTVIPDVERAILSMHSINFLGLRGQAKTRMARSMVTLLDEHIPVLEGSDLNEDPFVPLTQASKSLIEAQGLKTPVSWIHRDERYTEKLATPDVSVADLIGDVDPIRAATLKLPYSDERVIHFGLIPRANRGIFVINELPDLQARIQVALFNILQEGDIQIRGFKLRLPLDVQFVFTANPEDYTNRGSIVTPLKDRIDSQIVTHYPASIDLSRQITIQEAKVKAEQKDRIVVSDLIADLIEQIAVEARNSEYVDRKSGVSARMTISAYENLLSSIERRCLLNEEDAGYARISDLYHTIPAICGKVELVYEGEVEGPVIVAQNLIGKAIRSLLGRYFPTPEKTKKAFDSEVRAIVEWFGAGNQIAITDSLTEAEYRARLSVIEGLDDFVARHIPNSMGQEAFLFMEFALHGLAEYSKIGRQLLDGSSEFKDLLNSMLPDTDDFDEEDYFDKDDEN